MAKLVREQGETLRGVEDEAAREAIVAFLRSVGARSGGFGNPRGTLLEFLEAKCRDQVGTPTVVTTADTPPTHTTTDHHHPSSVSSPLRRDGTLQAGRHFELERFVKGIQASGLHIGDPEAFRRGEWVFNNPPKVDTSDLI